ncbi:unnamed protein product [Ectocarpus sp. 6 AP-2014]
MVFSVCRMVHRPERVLGMSDSTLVRVPCFACWSSDMADAAVLAHPAHSTLLPCLSTQGLMNITSFPQKPRVYQQRDHPKYATCRLLRSEAKTVEVPAMRPG